MRQREELQNRFRKASVGARGGAGCARGGDGGGTPRDRCAANDPAAVRDRCIGHPWRSRICDPHSRARPFVLATLITKQTSFRAKLCNVHRERELMIWNVGQIFGKGSPKRRFTNMQGVRRFEKLIWVKAELGLLLYIWRVTIYTNIYTYTLYCIPWAFQPKNTPLVAPLLHLSQYSYNYQTNSLEKPNSSR